MFYIGSQKISPLLSDAKTYTYNVSGSDNTNVTFKDGKGILNGLYTSSYIISNDAISNDLCSADSWEVVITFRETSQHGYNNIFCIADPNGTQEDNQVFNCGYEGTDWGTLRMFIGSNGYTWDIVSDYNSYKADNAWEYCTKLTYDNVNGYVWSIKNVSLGETTFTTIWSDSNTTKVGQNGNINRCLMLGNFPTGNYGHGNDIEYNLLNSYYTIDGVTTYLAEAN